MTGREQNLADRQADRIVWLDIAKGIAILSMLIGHNFEGLLGGIIYSFHMPLFFILAGYTFRPIKNKDIPKATLKDVKRLIVPCFMVRGVILLWNCLFKGALFSDELRSLCLGLLWGNFYGDFFGIVLPAVGIIWFLIALFWAKLVYRILLNMFEDRYRMPFLLIACFASMFLGVHDIILPQNADMLFTCILFMEIGYTLKKADFFAKINHWALLLIFTVWTYFCGSQYIHISMNARGYPGYGLCLVVALAGCICVFFFSKSIEEKTIAKPLIFFGKNSMVLLCIQSIAPHVYTSSTNLQRFMDMFIECVLAAAYVYAKRVFFFLHNRRVFGKR